MYAFGLVLVCSRVHGRQQFGRFPVITVEVLVTVHHSADMLRSPREN